MGTFKLNSDAAAYNDGTAAYGFVVRNDKGEVLAAGAKREIAGGSSTLIEARALLHGLNISAACGLRILQAESDSEMLIRSINGEFAGEPYVMAVVQTIRTLATSMGLTRFKAISRTANKLAHNLAHFCSNKSDEQVWIEDIPLCCNHFLREDVRLLPLSVV